MLQNLVTFRPTPGRLVLPDLCCDVAIVGTKAFVAGPLTHVRDMDHTGRDVTLLRISVIAARPLFQLPVSELTDQVVPLEDVHRRLARDIAERLETGRLSCSLQPMPPAETDRRFTVAARELTRNATVRRAAEGVAMSERQLERLFNEHAGIPPKMFARIARFRRAIISARQGMPLAVAAAAHGYADQSHFTREVRDLTALSPRALLRRVAFVQDAESWKNVGCES